MNHEVDLKPKTGARDAEPAIEQARFRDAESAFLPSGDIPEKVTKAEPVPIRPEMTVAEGFETVVRSCVRHFLLNEPMIARRRKGAALRQVRVAIRRLRTALSLFKPAMVDPQFDQLRGELRWFTGELGEARNLDVFLARNDLPPSLRKRLNTERKRAYGDVADAMESERLQLLLIDLAAWVELGRWRQNRKAQRPLPAFAARRLYKWWQRQARHDELESMNREERHEFRIETKKLRYALEFVQPLHAGAERKQKQFAKAIERLQKSLGVLNDLATARSISRKLGHKLAHEKGDVKANYLRDAQASLDRLRKIGPYWIRLA